MAHEELPALERAAVDPQVETLGKAAGEVVRAWRARGGRDEGRAEDALLYGAIFSGLAKLHPLAAAWVAVEVSRTLGLTHPATVKMAPGNHFHRSLWLRLEAELEEPQEGTPS